MKTNFWKALMPATCTVCVCAAESDSKICSHECTSWMIFSDLTKNNTNILHKNRDAVSRNIMPLKSTDGALRKWIGLGDKNPNTDKEYVCMGMNVAGLAVVVNSGEKTVDPCVPKADLGTPAIVKICLSECDTAEQAVKKLEEIRKARRYSHQDKGSIFFFMDLKEAFIVEMTAERCSPQRYDHGYTFRANIWHNPDMAAVSDNTYERWINSCNREFMVIRDINNAWRSNKKITVADSIETSRDTANPKESAINRTLCSKSTNSSSTLEISLAYPDVLSTGYFLIGPPRHTLCVPVPVCAEKYHPLMTDLTWSGAAWKSFDAKGYDAAIPAEWKAFENRSMTSYQATQEKAEQLLKSGKRAQAVKLLNDTAYSIWDEAAKIMKLPSRFQKSMASGFEK